MLSDPRVFQYVIMSLYILASVRNGVAGHWGQSMYWAGALWITCVVTFLLPKGL